VENTSNFEQSNEVSKATLKKHKEIVAELNQSPDWWNLRIKQRQRASIMSLKPMMYELWRTKQLTKKEIADAIRSTGYKISDTEMEYCIEHLGWKFNENDGTKPTVKKKTAKERAFEAAIIELGRSMPPHKMDPRVAARYYELTNILPIQTNANFFRATDFLCAIERKAREAWAVDKSLEEHIAFTGTVPPEEIKDDDEIMKWVKFI